MKHVGWFIWLKFDSDPKFTSYEFYNLNVKGVISHGEIDSSEYEGEQYVSKIMEIRKIQFGASTVGYTKAFSEV